MISFNLPLLSGFADAAQICLSGFSSFQPKIENEDIGKNILIEDGNQNSHVRNEDYSENVGDHHILTNKLKTNESSNKYKKKSKTLFSVGQFLIGIMFLLGSLLLR